MSREEALEYIEEQLGELQMRTQGFGDWKGEINLRQMAEDLYRIAREVT